MENAVRCANCKYYDTWDDETLDGKYICRRHAPVPSVTLLVDDNAWDDALAWCPGTVTWPVLGQNEWCGEFEPIAAIAEAEKGNG